MGSYVLRYDDICESIDQASWRMVKEKMLALDIKPILAVIPDNENEQFKQEEKKASFWEEIRELQKQGWHIALHGYNHVYLTENAGMLGITRRSEFAGVSYDVQKSKIEKGLEIFRKNGITPEMWIAPAHSFDKTTLKILKSFGITVISDGLSHYPFHYYGFKWIPCKLWSFPEKDAFGVNTICIHLSKMKIEEVEAFCESMAAHRDKIIDPDIYIRKKVSVFGCVFCAENWLRVLMRKRSGARK